MEQKLYKLMDWRAIEGILYADTDQPSQVLGSRMTRSGRLIMAFVPDSVHTTLKLENKNQYKMELVDEAGIFAALIPKKETGKYRIHAEYAKGVSYEYYDCYQFSSTIDNKELKKLNQGTNCDAYKILGAHPMTIEGVEGVRFAVWAPNATRVSVVGDFNFWDGRRHMMSRLGDSGVFEIFIPDIEQEAIYKYEIANWAGSVELKADPYAFYSEYTVDGASKIWDIEQKKWSDEKWMKARVGTRKEEPLRILKVDLTDLSGEKSNQNYRELAEEIIKDVKNSGYTHIQLEPVMEYHAYYTHAYYAPTGRFGTPDDFADFVDTLHQNHIGIILEWNISEFPMDESGMGRFDGTALYEHQDARQGCNQSHGTYLFNYARNEVANFLISNICFWTQIYHVDGISIQNLPAMLYLDYDKQDGEWIPNMYGGNENLDAVAFLQILNDMIKKRDKSVIMIADDESTWPLVTGSVKEDGLGFDYKWNYGWMNDFTDYMKTNPYERHHKYSNLTFSMVYAYSEDFLLPLLIQNTGDQTLLEQMPGEDLEQKYANLRLLYGYQILHPGKKLSQNGIEYQQKDSSKSDVQFQDYCQELGNLYINQPALYELDYQPKGFEWINNIENKKNILSFVRKGKNQILLVICNFGPDEYSNYQVGVSKKGKYKEIFNSDDKKFGGTGFTNPRMKQTKAEECDERKNSIQMKVPAFGISVWKYIPAEETKKEKNAVKSKEITGSSEVAQKIQNEMDKAREEEEHRKFSKDEIQKLELEKIDKEKENNKKK